MAPTAITYSPREKGSCAMETDQPKLSPGPALLALSLATCSQTKLPLCQKTRTAPLLVQLLSLGLGGSDKQELSPGAPTTAMLFTMSTHRPTWSFGLISSAFLYCSLRSPFQSMLVPSCPIVVATTVASKSSTLCTATSIVRYKPAVGGLFFSSFRFPFLGCLLLGRSFVVQKRFFLVFSDHSNESSLAGSADTDGFLGTPFPFFPFSSFSFSSSFEKVNDMASSFSPFSSPNNTFSLSRGKANEFFFVFVMERMERNVCSSPSSCHCFSLVVGSKGTKKK